MKVGRERIRTERDRLSAALRARKVLNGCRLCLQSSEHCVWCLVFGVWCLVFGVWCLVFAKCC